MHKHAVMYICIALLAIPSFARADALGDLRTQLEALTAQVSRLEQQIRALMERFSASAPAQQPSLAVGNPFAEFFSGGTSQPIVAQGASSSPTNDILRSFNSGAARGVEQSFSTASEEAVRCVTQWGNKSIDEGATISSEPYFNNGFSTGGYLIPLMRCVGGAWHTCDHEGKNCADTGGRIARPLCFDNSQRYIEGVGTVVCRAGVWRK